MCLWFELGSKFLSYVGELGAYRELCNVLAG